ncbi:MAG: hypothetical protein IJG85_04350, partial [Eubacteriaceae bacterium]|nr:hypothetical protein [Eubacteriaceae bacterium]
MATKNYEQTRRCRQIIVDEMRKILSWDEPLQQLILGENYKQQLNCFRKLIAHHKDKSFQEWCEE